jgi:hypothetical protein
MLDDQRIEVRFLEMAEILSSLHRPEQSLDLPNLLIEPGAILPEQSGWGVKLSIPFCGS